MPSILNQSAPAAPAPAAPAPAAPAPAAGAYTLSGAPVEPLPAGWGTSTSANSSGRNSGTSTPKNPLRSTGGPRVTGFRDLAAASSTSGSGGPSGGGFGGFGRLGGGGDDSDDDGDEGKDPSSFYTGGAKSGLSVENPDDARRRGGGGVSDMLKNILQQAREGSSRLAGGEDAPAAAAASGSSSFFTGSAHTLGSDETPSTYIPDPTTGGGARHGGEEEEEEEEEEVAVRHLTFWQDGFSIDDGDLMRYDEHRELLAAIQAGRAPISLLKVKHDQPVELRIAERRNEPWTRQPPPPQGPFAGSGHRLGAGSPFPEEGAASSASATTTSKMPGTLPSATATASASGGNSAGGGIVEFEVDRNEPTTQVQIRLRNGERMVATFNHTHTVGDIRQYIDRSRPGEASQPYVLQTTFPTRELTDLGETIKQAGLLGSVVVQRPT